MSEDNPPDYSLKRLRDLALHAHEENIAFLLRSTLKDFPIPVIDEYFTKGKLKNPSGPDEREWADYVRLIFIAFAPVGSEPARLRGKSIERYNRDPQYPSDDAPGTMVLYPSNFVSPLLKDIATALGVTDLKILSSGWFSRFLQDPFPLKKIRVEFSLRGVEWQPITGLQHDISEIFEVLPENLEELRIDLSPRLPFSGGGVSRLKLLRKFDLKAKALTSSLDFSANTSLEAIDLEVYSQDGEITGLGDLPILKCVSISSGDLYTSEWNRTQVDRSTVAATHLGPLDGILSSGLEKLILSGVRYGAESLKGKVSDSLRLDGVSGPSSIAIDCGAGSRVNIMISKCSPELVEIKAGGSLDIHDCSLLKSISAELSPSTLRVKECPVLNEATFSLASCSPYDVEFSDLPSLVSLCIDAEKLEMDVDDYYKNPQFKIIECGIRKFPRFTGGCRGLKAIDLVANRFLENLDGIDALTDLQTLFVRSAKKNGWFGKRGEVPVSGHRSLKQFFSVALAGKSMPFLTRLLVEYADLESLEGIGMFANVTTVELRSLGIMDLEGMELLSLLQKADLSGCSMRSLAPLAGLTNLMWLKSSGCDRIKPKLPHTVLEGAELTAELARHVSPDHPIAKNAPSEELTKIVQLIGEGKRSDVNQAASLLAVLSSEESDKILAGAAIDPKSGWIRLPYLTKIKDEEAMGIPQLRILMAIGGAKADALLDTVKEIVINGYSGEEVTLVLGKKPEGYSNDDGILEEFDSVASLPDLANVTSISINRVSRFSLKGVKKFSGLENLTIKGVDLLDDLGELEGLASLKSLRLDGVNLSDLTCLGSLPLLESLWLSDKIPTLEGLENFPSINKLIFSSVDDLGVLNKLAAEKGWKVSCHCSGFVDDGMPVYLSIQRRAS